MWRDSTGFVKCLQGFLGISVSVHTRKFMRLSIECLVGRPHEPMLACVSRLFKVWGCVLPKVLS